MYLEYGLDDVEIISNGSIWLKCFKINGVIYVYSNLKVFVVVDYYLMEVQWFV